MAGIFHSVQKAHLYSRETDNLYRLSIVRLMRGWAGQLLATAISCVAVNVLLLASDSAWFDEDSTDNDPTPRGRRDDLDRKRSERSIAGTFPNAPPVAA